MYVLIFLFLEEKEGLVGRVFLFLLFAFKADDIFSLNILDDKIIVILDFQNLTGHFLGVQFKTIVLFVFL